MSRTTKAFCSWVSKRVSKLITVQAYARLHARQREQGVGGHVAEVGVYQGRGFIPLCLLCGPQVSTPNTTKLLHPRLLTSCGLSSPMRMANFRSRDNCRSGEAPTRVHAVTS